MRNLSKDSPNLTLSLPEVINMKLLTVIFIHYRTDR